MAGMERAKVGMETARTSAMDRVTRPDPRARAREIAGLLGATAGEIERTRRIPEPLLGALHDSRLFRMLLPRVYGGDEVAPGAYLLALEEIAKADASVAWNMFVANSSALIAAYLAPETAAEIFADRKTIIAWGPPNACRVCRQANWMGAHGLVVEAGGEVRLNPAGRPHVRTLLFPVEQARLLDTWDTIGLRGTASDSYAVEDVFVPESHSATREDPALRLVPGPLYAIPQQALYAVGVAGVALGTAGAMLAAFGELAMEKTPRGLSRLADDEGVIAEVGKLVYLRGAVE